MENHAVATFSSPLKGLSEENTAQLLKEVTSEIRKDFKLMMLYLHPTVNSTKSLQQFANELGVLETVSSRFFANLEKTGLWVRDGNKIEVTKNCLDLGELQIAEHLSMSLNIISRLGEEGPCWYDTLFIVTNEELKKKFYRKINQALSEFIEESKNASCDRVVAWNHSALDCTAALKK